MLTSLTDDAHGAVDAALAKLKLKRTIALTTPGFFAVPFVVRRAPVITTMPSRLARYFAETFGLAYAPTYSVVFTFVIMAVVLAFRPQGILGRRERIG